MKLETEIANVLKLEIHHGSYVELDSTWKYENVCNDFSRLYFIHDGDGYIDFKGERIPLKKGYVYLIPSGCEFSYGCTYLSKLFFHITLTAMENYDLLTNVNRICWIPFSQETYDALLRCRASSDYLVILKMKVLLQETLLACAEKYRFAPFLVKQYSELVSNTIKYIQSHVGMNLYASEISKALFVSESKIRKAFKEETGETLGKYIDDRIFFRAKQLLAKKHITIGEISQNLGFCDQFYFSRRFKEKFGKTPSEFRRELIVF